MKFTELITTSDIYENENIPQEEDLFAEKEEAYADTVSRSSEQAKVPEDVTPFSGGEGTTAAFEGTLNLLRKRSRAEL